jgi:hypothetical protein
MATARVTATATTPSQPAPATGQRVAPREVDPIDQLRLRFAKHDRPLAEVRRLVDADMGDRLLSEELRALRADA